MITVLDPGHGGEDSGAVVAGLREKNLALQITKHVEALLARDGRRFWSTRWVDQYVTLSDRVRLERRLSDRFESAAFLSIHINAARNAGARGIRVYHYPGSRRGEALATSILDSSEDLPLPIGGARPTDTRRDRDEHSYIMVVAETVSPAVLVEAGFLTNKHDRAYLSSDHGPWDLGRSIYRGIKVWNS